MKKYTELYPLNWIQTRKRRPNGRVSDEEALARWEDPERGMLMPSVFIPVLEDAKLIYKLDLFVAKQITEKMKKQAEKCIEDVFAKADALMYKNKKMLKEMG